MSLQCKDSGGQGKQKVQTIYQAEAISCMILSKLLAFSSFFLDLHFHSGH